jgi:alpha-N-arabinofuranosidase
MLLAIAFAGSLGAADALIEIDAARPAAYKIPRTIYGTFLEPIGHSIYPGLWAQILENPGFEDNLWSLRNLERMVEETPALKRSSAIGLPVPWQPLDAAQGVRYEPRWNDAANSFRSLEIMALPGNETGIRQTVYLPAHRVLRYQGSIYVRHLSGPPAVEISLRRHEHPENGHVTNFPWRFQPMPSSRWSRPIS